MVTFVQLNMDGIKQYSDPSNTKIVGLEQQLSILFQLKSCPGNNNFIIEGVQLIGSIILECFNHNVKTSIHQ